MPIGIRRMRNKKKVGYHYNIQQAAVKNAVRVDAKDGITVATVYSALIIRHLERMKRNLGRV